MAISKIPKFLPDRCNSCLYYDASTPEVEDGTGYCRRMPPIGGEGWPVVDDGDWCGEYKTGSLGSAHLSIPEAGKKYFGLSSAGSYLAAKRGDLPWVEIGGYKRVPVSAMRHLVPREE